MGSPDIQDLLRTIYDAKRTIVTQQPSRFNVEGKLIQIPKHGEIVVIGDLHGDFKSLNRILDETKFHDRAFKGESLILICLGDYIDRGPNQVEVLYSLLKLLNEHPSKIILLRGNHEGPSDLPVSPHDFPYILRDQYGEDSEQVYQAFKELTSELYMSAFIPEMALLVHGGIPVEAKSLEDIAEARNRYPNSDSLIQILWNDPMSKPGVMPSPRGAGYYFGPDISRRFLDSVNLRKIIRGHQSSSKGFEIIDDVITLFSCKLPMYGNLKAAYMVIPLVPGNVLDFEERIRTF